MTIPMENIIFGLVYLLGDGIIIGLTALILTVRNFMREEEDL